MIITNRLFIRQEPSRDAKKIYILSEGKVREPQYFNYFENMDSRIKLIVIPTEQHDNNSPVGLFSKAAKLFIKNNENQDPKYELLDNDEVWFVIDTDDWKNKITELRTNCCQYNNWHVVQSNPCFEVWLYFHIKKEIPEIDDLSVPTNWKQHLNDIVPGGFNSKNHPIYIEIAINNSKEIFSKTNDELNVACTEVHLLAESFFPLIKDKISDALKIINK